MVTLDRAEQLSVLNEMGIAWYVPTSFDSSEFVIRKEADQIRINPESQIQSVEVPRPSDILRDIPTAEEITAATVTEKVEPAAIPAVSVAPFHWLIARAGFVTFICEIKQAKFAAVWHNAVRELLADIAIALGSKTSLNTQYFSWPPAETNLGLADTDLGDFLSEYLSPDDSDPVFVLMGSSALEHATPDVLNGAKHVATVALGQLFRDYQQKKLVWQQLKPLCR